MLNLVRFLAFSASWMAGSVVANTGVFTNPSEEAQDLPTYTVGQAVNITWTDTEDYSILSLGVVQDKQISWLIQNSPYNPTSFQWVVSYLQYSADSTAPFIFEIVNGTTFGDGFVSGEFFIAQSSSSTSTSTATSTSSAASTATPISTTSSATTSQTSAAVLATSTVSMTATLISASPTSSSTTTPTQAADASSNLSSSLTPAAKAGLGIGITLAFLTGITAAYILFRAHNRRNTKKMMTAALQEQSLETWRQDETVTKGLGLDMPNKGFVHVSEVKTPPQRGRCELDANSTIAEKF